MLRIVNTIMVHDQSIDNRTKLEKPMPFLPVAGQPRRLQGENRADLPLTNFCQEGLKALTLHMSTSRTPQVVVNDLYLRPPQLASVIHQPILPSLAFKVVLHLGHRGLSDVNVCRSAQMMFLDFTH